MLKKLVCIFILYIFSTNGLEPEQPDQNGLVPKSRVRRIAFPPDSTLEITAELLLPIPLANGVTSAVCIELPVAVAVPPAETFFATYYKTRSIAENRLGFFSGVETMLKRFGIDGKECVLRTICEVAEVPLLEDGLLGEVLNLLISASKVPDDYKLLEDYVNAEKYGRKNGNCEEAYSKCPFSLFKVFEI
ncbi:uncharacterized protein LOC143228056 [Tachypleus tridentatus]|uniref:uncharacterized protein LOC143228056 n=1 Tax=Tachypleus tridentatus TaxID=6853 RepID=UPI003FD094C9